MRSIGLSSGMSSVHAHYLPAGISALLGMLAGPSASATTEELGKSGLTPIFPELPREKSPDKLTILH